MRSRSLFQPFFGPVSALATLHGRALGLRAAAFGAAVIGFGFTILFLLLALHLWLAPHVGNAAAALLTALVVSLSTIATGAILLLLARDAGLRARQAQAPIIAMLPLALPMVRRATPKVLMAAATAGLAVGLLRRR